MPWSSYRVLDAPPGGRGREAWLWLGGGQILAKTVSQRLAHTISSFLLWSTLNNSGTNLKTLIRLVVDYCLSCNLVSCTAGLEEEHLFSQDLLLFVLVVQGEFEEKDHLQEYVHVEDVGYTRHQHHSHDHCQVCVLTLPSVSWLIPHPSPADRARSGTGGS